VGFAHRIAERKAKSEVKVTQCLLFGPLAVLHFCNWGGSRGGIGCDRGGIKGFNPLTPTVAIWIHPVPDRVKPSFVIFDIRALWHLGLSVRVPGCQKLQMTA